METLEFSFPAEHPVRGRAHVGVVGSGDLEILIEPGSDSAEVQIHTSVPGYGEVWRLVLQRFIARHRCAARWRIHDFGATPGVVALRLEQALEASQR